MAREKTRQRLAIRKAFAPKKKVQRTPTHKQHRFESFTHRVARLRIDPIRRDRGLRHDDRDLEALESHFRIALDRWRDLNLSEDFTKFARQIDAVCDNLPQVLHHQDKIVELLLEGVEKSSVVSAEPFLDLVAHLAQDLQAQFAERHFERTVRTVAGVAARHQDVEVVEWSFNCLTWLFKYLERILAADICPLYDLLAPYLGKERQKPFVSRFAAESLSFLVKRVGKKRDATVQFVRHALQDFEATAQEKDTELYEHSLIALFLEALKSVKESLHSTAATIFAALIDETLAIQKTPEATEATLRVVREVFHQLIHHTSAQNLEPLLDIVYNITQSSATSPVDHDRFILTSQLLLLASSVKNGHRVANWSRLFSVLGIQIAALTTAGPATQAAPATELLVTLAVAHQKCPLDAALASLGSLDKVCNTEWQTFFPGFCNLYAEEGSDRFKSFLLPRLQRFLTTCWDGQTRPLSVLIPKLVRNGAVTPRTLKITGGLEEQIEEHFTRLSPSAESGEAAAAGYNGLLQLLDSVASSGQTNDRIRDQLYTALLAFLPTQIESPLCLFVLGDGFMHVGESISRSDQGKKRMLQLLDSISEAAKSIKNFPAFFQSLAVFLKHSPLAQELMQSRTGKLLESTLLQCLSSSSHDLRLAALEILNLMIPSTDEASRTEMANAIDIESTEPSIESMRYISMKIKNLGMHYKTYSSNPILAEAIPRWLFGLLHVKLAQTWEDVCSAMKEISAVKEGEDAICEVAFHWLADAPVRDQKLEEATAQENGDKGLPDYYFSQLSSKALTSITFAERADEMLVRQFEERHQRVPLLTSFNRAQALRILKAVPALAEKRARQLVPVLLSWSGDSITDDTAEVAPVDDTSDEQIQVASQVPSTDELRWPRKDQKSLLSLFASFNNPRVLYRSDDVYSTLLTLLAHGDAEIQKSALQAVFAWKDKTLKKHADELMKFLDDARLREQLTVFLDSTNTPHADTEGTSACLPEQDRPIVMPIVLRLVYGRIIARSRDGRGSNRKAVFVVLAKFSQEEINIFLDVMLAPVSASDDIPLKRQLGMLNMIKDLLEIWRSTAAPYIPRVAPAVLACLLRDFKAEEATAMTKAARTVGMQCLNLCFEAGESSDFDWDAYMPELFNKIISPRLEKFAEENAQGVSALMRMFAIWAASPKLVRFLHERGTGLLEVVVRSLELGFAKEAVKKFVLADILGPLVAQAESNPAVGDFVRTSTGSFLTPLAALMVQPNVSKDLIADAVSTLTALVPYTGEGECPPELLEAAAKLVTQPAKKIPHSSKTELLSAASHFFPSALASPQTAREVFACVCASFAYFADGASRALLVNIAKKFAAHDGDLDEVISLLDGVNAFVPGRLDLPDFEKRGQAFATITEERWQMFTARQWRLLLGNLLFYIKDLDELAIRASASHALRRFVEASKLREDHAEKEEMHAMLQQLLASIESGLKDSPELVQIEYLSVLAEVARLPETFNPIFDMRYLLMAGDEEANLFNNLLHVQQHRRVRAMNRLATVAAEGNLASRNLYRFIVPLLEGFVVKSTDGVLVAEAMKCLGNLVEWLDWQQFRVLVRRYVGWIKTKEDVQEKVLRLVDGVAEGLVRSAAIRSKIREKQQQKQQEDGDGEDEEMGDAVQAVQTKLSRTMPGPEKLAQYVTDEVIPPLSLFLREKDDSFVSRRISVALVAAKFVHLLPELDFQLRFPPLLTDVCNILRSKDQGSRDMTRRALSSMCTLIGPSSFGFILRELRSALQRGFYLHVLAFSVHSILEMTISNFQPGDLDYCVLDIVDVIIEDVFGNTGKEKDIQEYKADKNTKKEVKGKKSFDTMQLVASVTSLGHLVELVRPMQGMLAGHLSIKEVRYVDELLRRIELGVLQNSSLKNRDVLRFCYEIIQEALKQAPIATSKKPQKKSSAGLVESAYLKPAPRQVSQTSLHAKEASGKIVRFALEMVRSVLKKNKDLLTPSNIAGFMPVIGDALLNPNEDVKLAALRVFTGILNVPLQRIDEDAPVYITEAARIVEDSQTHSGELEQAALKLISAILRERKSATVKVHASTISILLKRMKGELQVISQQGAAFNLLRAIIARQITVPELYEIMDGDEGVAAIAVRDHDRTTRDLARSTYVQFLMDSPQGPKRWAKQLTFLRGNLEYEYPEGRKSVMDVVHLLLNKVGDELIADVIKEMFWPLVAVMVNDSEADCREMAARLVKQGFGRAGEEWVESFVGLCRQLLAQGNAVQKRTALQSWALHLEVKQQEAEGVEFVLDAVREVLRPREFDAENWQVVYWALHTFTAIVQLPSEAGYVDGTTKAIWLEARRYINFPHLWVKQEAVTLFGSLLRQIAENEGGLDSLPLRGPAHMTLVSDDVCEFTSRHLRLLKEGVSKELADHTVRNLAFFGRLFASTGMEWHMHNANGSLAVREPEQDDDGEFKGLSDEEDAEEDSDEAKSLKETALGHLLFQLGVVIRREFVKQTTPAPRQESALVPKIAALKLLAALCNTLPETILQDAETAHTIIAPLVHLTSPDRSITAHSTDDFKTAHEELVKNSTELQDLLREKMGTTFFVKMLQKVQSVQREKREERRAKRKVDAVIRPEVLARKKVKRVERERERKKEKNEFHRGRRRGW